MLNAIKKLALVVLACSAAASSQGFSLLGPFDTWQVAALDYNSQPNIFYGGIDIGGPQGLGQQYRWNTPRLYYAYSAEFLAYYGQDGVNAVEKILGPNGILNKIPPVSQMSKNLTEFPLDTRNLNPTAAALGIIDLKSFVLSEILIQMGLANADRYVWTLRARYLPNGAACPNYLTSVIMRNYDPVTWNPSAYVNNVLYTYFVDTVCPPAPVVGSDALERTVDSTARGASALTDEESVGSLPGVYYTGITRDDAGGLRNLLSPRQVAVEALPLNSAIGGGYGAGLPAIGNGSGGFNGGGINGSPWNLAVGIGLTNATILGGGSSSPWVTIIFNGGTNGSTNSIVVTGPTNTLTGPFVTAGQDHITFRQVAYDSTVGIIFNPGVDNYYITTYENGRVVQELVTRIVAVPDIVIGAGDLGTLLNDPSPEASSRGFPNFVNSIGNAPLVNGPGMINAPTSLNFTDAGAFFENDGNSFQAGAIAGPISYWGSFDGTTNPPVVFPSGTSYQQLESQLFH
jgi:hypothetical protein